MELDWKLLAAIGNRLERERKDPITPAFGWYEELATRYDRASRIRELIDRYNQKIGEKRQAFEAEAAELNVRIDEMQSHCLHELTQYHPDPSGNSDNWTECLLCGKSVR